jgi:hypothetical protein
MPYISRLRLATWTHFLESPLALRVEVNLAIPDVAVGSLDPGRGSPEANPLLPLPEALMVAVVNEGRTGAGAFVEAV